MVFYGFSTVAFTTENIVKNWQNLTKHKNSKHSRHGPSAATAKVLFDEDSNTNSNI